MFLTDSWKFRDYLMQKIFIPNSHIEQENPTYLGSLNKANMVNRSVISLCPRIAKLIQSKQPRSDDNQEMRLP